MTRIGIGYDSHRWAEARRLVLGGIDIPCEKGLMGHSDADALLHAIGDAILGAVAAGDIGTHFPDTDPLYKGISSMTLLGDIMGIAAGKGYRIRNVDATIILEKPRLRDYIPGMVENLARTLNLLPEDISIKAKTNEGMGFIGRQEGLAVMAVVTVCRQEER